MKKTDHQLLEEAYDVVLESKIINKKFARRYNRLTRELLGAVHGSKEYKKLKDERDDLIKILNDHGKTVADLESFLTKKEIIDNEDANANEDSNYIEGYEE